MAQINYTKHVGINTYINKSHLVCGEDPSYHGIIWAGDIDWSDVDNTVIKLNDSASIITKLEEILSRLSSLEEIVNQLEPVSEATASISTTELGSRTTNNLREVTWSGRSISPSTITSGETGTITKGTVTAKYATILTETATITTSNIKGDLSITSSNINIVSIGTPVKNGETIITATAPGNSTIRVLDGSTLVAEFHVTVFNEPYSFDVTNDAIFKQFINGTEVTNSINDTTVTAPTVQSNTSITISAIYNDMGSTESVTYTAAPAANYYWYVGTEKPTSLNYEGVTTVNEYPAEQLYTNETGSKAYIYVLSNSDKTVNFYDPGDITSPATTDIDTTTIPGYKITSMNFRISIGGTMLIKIS